MSMAPCGLMGASFMRRGITAPPGIYYVYIHICIEAMVLYVSHVHACVMGVHGLAHLQPHQLKRVPVSSHKQQLQ